MRHNSEVKAMIDSKRLSSIHSNGGNPSFSTGKFSSSWLINKEKCLWMLNEFLTGLILSMLDRRQIKSSIFAKYPWGAQSKAFHSLLFRTWMNNDEHGNMGTCPIGLHLRLKRNDDPWISPNRRSTSSKWWCAVLGSSWSSAWSYLGTKASGSTVASGTGK